MAEIMPDGHFTADSLQRLLSLPIKRLLQVGIMFAPLPKKLFGDEGPVSEANKQAFEACVDKLRQELKAAVEAFEIDSRPYERGGDEGRPEPEAMPHGAKRADGVQHLLAQMFGVLCVHKRTVGGAGGPFRLCFDDLHSLLLQALSTWATIEGNMGDAFDDEIPFAYSAVSAMFLFISDQHKIPHFITDPAEAWVEAGGTPEEIMQIGDTFVVLLRRLAGQVLHVARTAVHSPHLSDALVLTDNAWRMVLGTIGMDPEDAEQEVSKALIGKLLREQGEDAPDILEHEDEAVLLRLDEVARLTESLRRLFGEHYQTKHGDAPFASDMSKPVFVAAFTPAWEEFVKEQREHFFGGGPDKETDPTPLKEMLECNLERNWMPEQVGDALHYWDERLSKYAEVVKFLPQLWDFVEGQADLVAQLGFTLCDISGDGAISANDAAALSKIGDIMCKGRGISPRRDILVGLPLAVFDLADQNIKYTVDYEGSLSCREIVNFLSNNVAKPALMIDDELLDLLLISSKGEGFGVARDALRVMTMLLLESADLEVLSEEDRRKGTKQDAWTMVKFMQFVEREEKAPPMKPPGVDELLAKKAKGQGANEMLDERVGSGCGLKSKQARKRAGWKTSSVEGDIKVLRPPAEGETHVAHAAMCVTPREDLYLLTCGQVDVDGKGKLISHVTAFGLKQKRGGQGAGAGQLQPSVEVKQLLGAQGSKLKKDFVGVTRCALSEDGRFAMACGRNARDGTPLVYLWGEKDRAWSDTESPVEPERLEGLAGDITDCGFVHDLAGKALYAVACSKGDDQAHRGGVKKVFLWDTATQRAFDPAETVEGEDNIGHKTGYVHSVGHTVTRDKHNAEDGISIATCGEDRLLHVYHVRKSADNSLTTTNHMTLTAGLVLAPRRGAGRVGRGERLAHERYRTRAEKR